MKTKGFSVTTAVIIGMDVICVAICAWQTAYLVSLQDIFVAAHPSYVSHSWILLLLLVALTALACGQMVLSHKRGVAPKTPGLCCSMSVLMIVLEVLALRAAAGQHYHMGMLISDYGLQAPFGGGWLLLFLAVALIVATIAQLLIVFLSALSATHGNVEKA